MKKLRLAREILIAMILVLGLAGMVHAEEDSGDSGSSPGAIAKSIVAGEAKNAAAEDDKKKQKGDGEFKEVDPSGAFQYQYLLNIPPGTNNMNPTLKLFYNSNCENGILGMGWTLDGIPKIERDFSYPVNYSSSDHFLYNGEKLVKDANGYYHPAKESFERIELKKTRIQVVHIG